MNSTRVELPLEFNKISRQPPLHMLFYFRLAAVPDSLPGTLTPAREKLMIFVLSAIQFCHVMDFVIMMPLGPSFMRSFDISPQEFGMIISAFTLSASISGFLGSAFIDRFDRKKALLAFYGCFAVGNILCGLAPSVWFLLAARIFAGVVAGFMVPIIFTIVGDMIPESRRGLAMGRVMSAFAMASIAGVPFGLFLANQYDWHAPFLFLGVLSLLILWMGALCLPSVNQHITKMGPFSAFKSIHEIISVPQHWRAYTLTVVMFLSMFFIIPYLSPYLVSNVGVFEKDLFYIYLVGGSVTVFTSPLIGRLADRFGKLKVFQIIAIMSIIPIILLTNLPMVSLPIAITCTTLFMSFASGRFVPVMSMITSSVRPQYRGGFMSINTSLQNLSASIATFLGGSILVKSDAGSLLHFGRVGGIAAVLTIFGIAIAPLIKIVDSK